MIRQTLFMARNGIVKVVIRKVSGGPWKPPLYSRAGRAAAIKNDRRVRNSGSDNQKAPNGPPAISKRSSTIQRQEDGLGGSPGRSAPWEPRPTVSGAPRLLKTAGRARGVGNSALRIRPVDQGRGSACEEGPSMGTVSKEVCVGGFSTFYKEIF